MIEHRRLGDADFLGDDQGPRFCADAAKAHAVTELD